MTSRRVTKLAHLSQPPVAMQGCKGLWESTQDVPPNWSDVGTVCRHNFLFSGSANAYDLCDLRSKSPLRKSLLHETTMAALIPHPPPPPHTHKELLQGRSSSGKVVNQMDREMGRGRGQVCKPLSLAAIRLVLN